MTADTLIKDLQELARAKFEESASCATTANAFLHCIGLVGHHFPGAADKADHSAAKGEPRPPVKRTKTASPGPRRNRIGNSVSDIFRDRPGAELMIDEIAEELTRRGVPFDEKMILGYLSHGVGTGDFKRCGNRYEAVKFREAQR